MSDLPAGLHASLAERKAIAVRLLIRRVFHVAMRGTEVDPTHILAAETYALERSRREFRLDRHGDGVEDLASEIAKAVYGEFESQFPETSLTVIQEAASQLASEGERLGCERCGGGAGRCGSVGFENDAQVHRGGSCVLGLKQAFGVAHMVAFQAYADAGVPAKSLEKVSFATNHDPGSDPFVRGLPVYVSGQTDPVPDTVEHRLVRFHVRGEHVRQRCIHASWYVAFHECTCHAFSDHGTSVSCPADDFYSEGWMDWLAHEFLVRALPLVDEEQAGVDVASIRKHSERYFDARGDTEDLEGDDSALETLAVYSGRKAAAALWSTVQEVTGDLEGGWSDFQRFSVALNRAADLAEQRTEFARAAYRASCLADEGDSTARVWLAEVAAGVVDGQEPEAILRYALNDPPRGI